MHIIKSKAEPATTRIQRLLEMLSAYSFNLYYIKGKDMILSDFLSRQRHDDSNLHEIIAISLNKQNKLHDRYYNIGILGKYISKVKEVSQIKPRLGQGRARLRCKIKTQISRPIAQMVEKLMQIPDIPKTQDKVMTIPNFAIYILQSKGDLGTKMIDRKTI